MRRILFLSTVLVLILAACGARTEGKVVFVTYSQTESSYTLNVNDGSGNQLLAPGGLSPSTFPDGSIAFSAPGNEEYDQGNRDIWRMSQNGNLVNLTGTRMMDEVRPVVSPDGELIAYFNNSVNGNLCFIKADGTDGWCLSNSAYVHTINCSLYGEQPSASCAGFDGVHINPQEFLWNPAVKDGESDLIVVSNWQGEGNKIYRIQLVDGLLVHINLIVDKAVNPTIGPDGKLAYYDYRLKNISLVNLDGSDNRVLVGQEIEEISWSPDGTLLAFSVYEENHDYSIYLMNSDGTGMGKIISGYSPIWSPDGTKILFLRSFANDANYVLSHHNKLFIYDLSTNTETLIHENDSNHLDTDAIFVK